MKRLLTALCLAAVAQFASFAAAADEAKPAADKAARYKEFEETMSGCVLRGSFTARDSKDKALREEKYTIAKVTKVPGDNDKWVFEVRIQYGANDATIPLTLDVLWSGDTPVITLTDFSVPGFGKFTSRVLIYRGQYCGMWEGGGDHGGHLFGQIEKLKAEEKK